jgi:hypothetical protein
MALCSSGNQGIYWARGRGVGPGRATSIFIGDMSLMNMLAYICHFHVTNEDILIFLATEEYKELYSSVLCSSAISLVNRGI